MITCEAPQIPNGYSIQEAAVLLGLTVRGVRHWIKVGKIKAKKIDNGWRYMIPPEEIERIKAGVHHD